MPTSVTAAAVFVVLIVPGLLLISGYRRARLHSLPQRDLYVLAQAVAVSLMWLPAVYVLGGCTILGWIEDGTVDKHETAILALIWANIAAAFGAGLSIGKAVDALGERPNGPLSRAIAWTGIFTPPTAWDAAWLSAARGEWAGVRVELQSGQEINVLFDRDSSVDLSPRSTKHLYFDTEYRFNADGEVEVEENEGIYIDGEEVVTFRFDHIEPAESE